MDSGIRNCFHVQLAVATVNDTLNPARRSGGSREPTRRVEPRSRNLSRRPNRRSERVGRGDCAQQRMRQKTALPCVPACDYLTPVRRTPIVLKWPDALDVDPSWSESIDRLLWFPSRERHSCELVESHSGLAAWARRSG